MKTSQFSFGEKTIETPSLIIKKNIMSWENTMIQLSNISYISAANQETLHFPGWAALIILLGFFLFESSVLLALILIAAGGIWLYSWYQANEKRRQGAILTIRMNSGHNLYFTFENKKFLIKVLNVLEQIIIDGGSNSQISINIRDCEIVDSSILSHNNA